MSKRVLCALSWIGWLALGGLTAAQAQIQVSIRAKNSQYLRHEPLEVDVTLRNEMGAELVLGETGEAVFAFDIEEAPGSPLARNPGDFLPEPWRIAPWKSETRTFNLVRHYPIRKQGPHRIVARVTVGKIDFLSNRLMVSIVPGLEIAREAGLTEDGVRREFTLRTLVRDRFDRVFLLIRDEASGAEYEAQNLGTIVRFYPPQLLLSSDGTIHVLHQSAPTRFTHSVTTLDGRPVTTRFYSAPDKAKAKLVADRRGRVRPEGIAPYEGDPVVEPVTMPETIIPKD